MSRLYVIELIAVFITSYVNQQLQRLISSLIVNIHVVQMLFDYIFVEENDASLIELEEAGLLQRIPSADIYMYID